MVTRATSAKLDRERATRAVVDELGPWNRGPGPVYAQLARGLAHAVDRGAIAVGTRLPSERDLAVAVAISRGTAVAAYDRLEAQGRIERRRGSGTYVSGDPLTLPEGREGTALVHRLVDASADDAAGPVDVVDLSLSVLPDAAGLGRVTLTTRDLERLDPPSGYSPWGIASLRDALADHVTGWGLPSTAEQVVVTSGAQQALSIAAACWIRPGDLVVVDEPTYPGSIAAFEQAGARLVGVPLDGDGPDPDALADALERHPVLVYLQPAVHSPTGTTATGARRRRLAALLARARVPLVEDRSLADLSWRSVPPPLATLVPDLPAIVVGSLGKRFWGGLRLGFLRAPAPLALRCARIKATQDLGTSALSQVVGERLLRTATEEDRRAMVAELRGRYRAVAGALRRAAPGWSWPEPAGGLSLWLEVGSSGEELVRRARVVGVELAPPGPLVADRADRPHVRASFADPRAADAARRLAAVVSRTGSR